MTDKDQEAKPKAHGSLDMDFFDDVDGWRGFIASIPNRVFDGVDLQSLGSRADGTVSIAAAWAASTNGGDRKRYTTEMREEIEAIVAAQSGGQVEKFPATADDEKAA